MSFTYECSDFQRFQEILKQMREMDDKIIYSLNTSLPTESFKAQLDPEKNCQSLYGQLQVGRGHRQDAIKKCIVYTADKVKVLRTERDLDRDNIQNDKKFKNEQRKLRMLQSELNVEDIVKDRTFKAFNERCRQFFKVDAL